ncbi:MAG: phosphatidate cytidylyltransferase [Methylobacter sp.]
MLLQRIITASVLVPLVVLAVIELPSEYFSLLVGLITLLAAWEWTNLINMNSLLKRGLFLLALVLPMLWMHFWTYFLELAAQVLDWPDIRTYSGIIEWFVVVPVLFWILMMLLIRNAPTGLLQLELKVRYQALIGWLVLFAAWMFLSRLRAFFSYELTLYLLILIWAADIAAYFVGKKFGKTQLAPDVSPGKTVQGMYGALVAGLVCAIVLSLIYSFPWMVTSDFALLSVLTVLVSIYGDLFFSLAKRKRGVKDSGSILPGHGGILDRIDSLIAAIPFFYAGIILIYPS